MLFYERWHPVFFEKCLRFWMFKYEKAEQEKLYAQTHQKTVEVAVEKQVPYEKCEKCDRTVYQKAKEKCDNRKIQLEKKYKNMTTGYESIMFLLAWYSTSTTLFAAILSPAFLNDSITFFGTIGKGIVSLLQEFVTDADSFGQLSNRISNSIMMAIMSTAIAIYFGKWIKSIIPMNLILLLLLVHVVYIGIRCYVKDWREERGYY